MVGSLSRRAAVFLVALCLSSTAWAEEPRIAASAVRQIQALTSVKMTKSKDQNKIDSRLYLGLLHQRKDPRLSSLTDFRFVKPEADGKLPVDIILSDVAGIKPVLQLLESNGGVVRGVSVAYRQINARVRLTDLEALAAIPEVRKVRQAIPAFTNKINTSEGDLTHGVQQARGFFGVDGTGVKVCVLSDGVDSLAASQGTGDLPAVDVLPGQAGSGDEGTAMLEIVHDLAPGAELGFATAVTGEAIFAQNILDLAADGCNVIVDDIIYLDESPFQDGPVAQSVNTVTAAGVLYFSSAGNEGNKNDLTSGTWEGDFVPNGTPAALAGAGPVHNFGDGGQSILVEFGGGNPPLLIWAEHYDLSTGLASTDYDLYDMNGTLTTVFDASADTQDGSGGDDFPIEFIGGGAFAGERLVVAKFADGTTSSAPMFNLILFRGELDDALTTSGTTRGHSAAADAFSVAATPAAASFDGVTPDGPFPGLFTSANETESFSADGPRRIILDPTGAELTPGNRTSTGGVVRQKPDITAADGVSTSAPGFNPFYGTSAAAPHAAAIAALLKSAQPSLTPAQVRTALINSAIDIETPGVDRDTGAGIIMAHEALEEVGATPQAFLAAGTAVPSQVVGDGDAFIESNEAWNLTVPLTNVGGAGATGISATLTSSTPGVTITSGTSTYLDLAPSASGNNATPFTFVVSGTVPCGGMIEFTLTATYTGGTGSPQTFDLSFQIGAPGTPVTFSYAGPAVPIPDGVDGSGTLPGAPVAVPLAVAGVTGNVYDVDFQIDGATCTNATGSTTVGLDHSFVNDLELTVLSPAGTTSLVINNTDGGGNNFCQTVLDDESAGPSIQSVISTQAPFTGSFTPGAPLSIFDGEVANGAWQLQAQDFFAIDTGNIRAFSVIITPAVCDAPALTTTVTGTKTVSGTFNEGGTVTYTVTLTNHGPLAQADNAGDEFTDVLPASLTLVSANASSGTAVATVGTNTVTWNGPLAPFGGSVTITITATINAGTGGTTISNQGAISFDGNGDGTNEGIGATDDPGTVAANDPTSFAVAVVPVPVITGTKTVSGTPAEGSNITYTVILTNSGDGVQPDNPGDELTDVLPPTLTLVSATATSGTAGADIPTNTVTWNGSIPAAGSVTITIVATIEAGTGGQTITNQATFIYDADADGTNETPGATDDPAAGGASDATAIVVQAAAVVAIPTLSEWGAIILLLALLSAGMFFLRRRQTA
jgi:uncharacterized repeat protein (TIGR01451 family)